ncbi:MAG: SRPBCC family protein [Tetrasphaera sp.]|nr:SRPBCC family protein [Tetrasphaera sp.]
MELTHDFIVPADVESTWATFMDLEKVGGCFPGATVTDVSGDSFSGTVKVKLGPIALQYAGSGSFIERDDAAKRAVIEAKGKDKRGNGTAGATVTMQLAPSAEGTRVDVATELQITGKPAQFGRGVMQDVSDKLLQQFIGCIEGQFAAAGAPAEAPPAAAAAPEAPAAPAAPEVPAPPEAATPPAPAAAPAAPRPPARPAAPPKDDAIDLGATVLPVIIKSYAPHVVGALVAVLLGYLLGRRKGRR